MRGISWKNVQRSRSKKSLEPEPELEQDKEAFKLTEEESALKEFTIRYSTEVADGALYDPETFLDDVKETVINLLRNNRQTKVRLELCCTMERPDIKSGQIKRHEACFYSGVN